MKIREIIAIELGPALPEPYTLYFGLENWSEPVQYEIPRHTIWLPLNHANKPFYKSGTCNKEWRLVVFSRTP